MAHIAMFIVNCSQSDTAYSTYDVYIHIVYAVFKAYYALKHFQQKESGASKIIKLPKSHVKITEKVSESTCLWYPLFRPLQITSAYLILTLFVH